MKVIATERKPIKMWLNDIEDGALEQAKALANLPFTFKHVAIMPDAHQGYGMPIGGVLATEGVVIPNAVGVDIGCGMQAVETTLSDLSAVQLQDIVAEIKKVVPVGFNHQKEEQTWNGFLLPPNVDIILQELNSAKCQLGTLGGGNHFIEIQHDDSGHVWFMLHSGSRNFGLKIAKKFNSIAQDLCDTWHSNIPPSNGEDGLAFLPILTKEGKDYISAMNYALKFARENRFRMMRKVLDSVIKVMGSCETASECFDVHHNYAATEHHFGRNVIVHRKGATSAKKGQLGIIPGSQGTSSYIVEGLGCADSFMSCSHGAGRKMGRKEARKVLDLNDEKKRLDNLGIIHSITDVDDLDEAPSAYKDIECVMDNQKDLVRIVTKLTPLAVIKG